MKNNAKLLETNIGNCGTMFRVTDKIKDGTFSPGSKGHLAFIMGPDCNCPNVVFYKVITIRRGKGGKPRLNQNMILMPIFKLPGVPLDLTIPSDVERKYFVDVDIDHLTTFDCMGDKATDDKHRLEFLGQMYARTSFATELDNVNYPGEHQIIQATGVTPGSKTKIWPTSKGSVIRKYNREAESLVNGGEFGAINDLFYDEVPRMHLIKRIREIESLLALPRLEYQRKVGTVMMDALKHITKCLNTKEAKKLENLDELKASVKATQAVVGAEVGDTKNTIKARLDYIKKNRKLLKL